MLAVPNFARMNRVANAPIGRRIQPDIVSKVWMRSIVQTA